MTIVEKTERDRTVLRIKSRPLFLLVFFAISCINSITLSAWMILIPAYLVIRYKKEGAVEAFILLQLRSILSTGVAAPITGTAGYIKWSVVFLLSFYLLAGYKNVRNPELKQATGWVALFSIFAAFAAWVSSSYPVTSNFKTLSYVIPFIAILIGISETPEVDWIHKITVPLGLLCLGSAVLIGSAVGYLRNGTSFQGVFNHPNLYGVVLGLFLAGFLYPVKRLSVKSVAVIAAVIALASLTRSRTGMITILVVVLLFLLSLDTRASTRVLLIALLVFLVAMLVLLDTPIVDAFLSFIQKGHADDILYSRNEQLASALERFRLSPILGTGFNVPYRRNYRSYAFSFDLITENGNLIFALLGDVGIIGFILFLIAYIRLYRDGRGARTLIFFAPFLVSMGEMTFFSTNNIAIIMYLYFGVYARDGWLSRQPLPELAESEGPIR